MTDKEIEDYLEEKSISYLDYLPPLLDQEQFEGGKFVKHSEEPPVPDAD